MLACWDSPPSAALWRQKRETMSPESVWKTCLSFVLAGPPIFSLLYVPVKSFICDMTTAFPSIGLLFLPAAQITDGWRNPSVYYDILLGCVLVNWYSARTKKPRPKWSSRDPSRRKLPWLGNGNVVRSMYPRGLFNSDRRFVSIDSTFPQRNLFSGGADRAVPGINTRSTPSRWLSVSAATQSSRPWISFPSHTRKRTSAGVVRGGRIFVKFSLYRRFLERSRNLLYSGWYCISGWSWSCATAMMSWICLSISACLYYYHSILNLGLRGKRMKYNQVKDGLRAGWLRDAS